MFFMVKKIERLQVEIADWELKDLLEPVTFPKTIPELSLSTQSYACVDKPDVGIFL